MTMTADELNYVVDAAITAREHLRSQFSNQKKLPPNTIVSTFAPGTELELLSGALALYREQSNRPSAAAKVAPSKNDKTRRRRWKFELCCRLLRKLYGDDGPLDSVTVDEQIEELNKAIKADDRVTPRHTCGRTLFFAVRRAVYGR